MARPPGSARVLDLQSLKQAMDGIARAIELFAMNDKESDAEALAQAVLAERFLLEFVEHRQKPVRKTK